MYADSRQPIAAVATAPGRGGIGIVRVSGQNLATLVQAITGKRLVARHATRGSFLGADGTSIDDGMALWFPAPASYTGEDVLELHGHGGPVVLQMLLSRCQELGARLAEPGEFTYRAFANGKLDLAQAEGVADIIEASTAQAARSALASLRGEFSSRINALVERLIELRALVEATLDFPEEDIDAEHRVRAAENLAALRADLNRVFEAGRQGSILRQGLTVVLAGQPNVGKSSLLNRLAGEELAIVTDIPGTTRDSIRQDIQIEGVPLHVIDTAGLRAPGDAVEAIGIQRTWEAIERADVLLLVVDARSGLTAEDQAIVAKIAPGLARITVHNKADLLKGNRTVLPEHELRVSAATGEGLAELRQALLAQAGWHAGEDVVMARERHLQALERALGGLERASSVTVRLELFAEELRLAQEALVSITGEYSSDDLLGEIFSRFCIGK
ncbi:MAG TPA: tRNA uridine-5-carboxymethylaminomethyl(34) synthesis GTPase MnmE [Burkholderiales bacterium]|nr:tRNA uridine-5-carboxymethylaminomethyl(34) synthesis GTPase MnmE [Burkholderiales bacterium]